MLVLLLRLSFGLTRLKYCPKEMKHMLFDIYENLLGANYTILYFT